MDADKIICEFPKGLINWYNFNKSGNALLISNKTNVLEELLQNRCNYVECVSTEKASAEEFNNKYKGYFDYIIMVGILEVIKEPTSSLKKWRELLKANGRMLIGSDNRLGLRYFCGDRDPFTDRSFDGIENYRRVRPEDRTKLFGRNYSKEELSAILEASGLFHRKFYSVLPNLEAPQLLYAEGCVPKEKMAIRYFPMYNHPDSVFLEEEYLYDDLIKNGLFHTMANSYLIECSLDGNFDVAEHVTISLERGRENAFATIIENGGRVIKKALYPEGYAKLAQIKGNVDDLRQHGLNVIGTGIESDSFVMPYIESEIALNFLGKLAKSDVEKFINEMDYFKNLIMKSSEPAEVQGTEDDGIILKRGYIDLVPLNCFYDNGDYIFYDQEFFIENYPVNVIIYRLVSLVYMYDPDIESILPIKFFWERYGLEKRLDYWAQKSWSFISELRNQKELRIFNERYKRDNEVVNTNRQKINYSQAEYQRIFIDILKNTEKKKIVLFGSGNFTKRFLAQFGTDYDICAIVDNNSDRWGEELDGIKIQSPDFLKDIEKDEIRLIICVKNYTGIVQQLKGMGINDYCIYDKNMEYPRKEKQAKLLDIKVEEKNIGKKKYHIGYIAGVFDLFHVGHLNMFKRAKEQCDYLIVGVVSDEGVRKYKKTEPFIPFEERLEMVRSCVYVDEAVKIPLEFNGTRDAYNMYHFDCQFSGSDYVENSDWQADKAYLEKNGSDMVFFSYTEGTSSSKIKALIEKKLL